MQYSYLSEEDCSEEEDDALDSLVTTVQLLKLGGIRLAAESDGLVSDEVGMDEESFSDL